MLHDTRQAIAPALHELLSTVSALRDDILAESTVGSTSPLGQYGFDQRHREDVGDLPRGQDQSSEGRGVFHRTQQPWHRRIIIA